MSAAPSEHKRKLAELLQPHESITNPLERRRAGTLAIISVLLALATIVVFLVNLPPAFDSGFLRLVIVLAVALGSLALSRSRSPEWGGRLLAYGVSLIAVLSLFSRDSSNTILPTLIGLPVIILLISVTAGSVDTFLVSVVLSIGAFIYLVNSPADASAVVLTTTAITAIVGLVATINTVLRERDSQRIEEQSRELERFNLSMSGEVESRTRDILTMAEIGQVMTATRELDPLLDRVVSMITDRFDFYHAQVFLIDESGRWAVLRKSSGVAGQELLARGHRLEVGSRSVIGQVTARGEPTVARDTDVDAVHRRNELLPHTRSEMALPLRIGGRTIGALDVQSVNPNAFEDTDVAVFQTVADQLAVAIENARLFQQAEEDLRNIETLNRQLTGEAWRRFLAGRAQQVTGYSASISGVTPIEEDDPEEAEGTVSLPLKVRGQTIGMIDLTSRDGQSPDSETLALLEAVAERVALALDSSRLGEQAEFVAEREQILSRLSAELQATTDLNVILRTAASEASRAMGSPRAFVYLMADYSAEASDSPGT